jgi:hypothetical protein
MAVFCVAAPYIALMMEAVQTAETSVNLYQSTRRYNPQDSHFLVTALRTSSQNICFVRFIP